jgi:hypothetical protein
MPDHINDNRPASVGPIIISQSETDILIAVQISNAELARHRRLLENLLILANRTE